MKIILVLLILLIQSQAVYAYLDTGTLSIIINFIIGFFATIVVFSLDYLKKIKNFFTKKKSPKIKR